MGAGWNGSMRGLLSFFGLALFTEGGEVGGFETAFTKKIKRELIKRLSTKKWPRFKPTENRKLLMPLQN